MIKPVLLLSAAALMAGCSVAGLAGLAGLGGAGAPGAPAAGATVTGNITLTTASAAEMDALIACAKSKGPTGVALAAGWETSKTSMTDAQRAAVVPAIEMQAKAIGCMVNGAATVTAPASAPAVAPGAGSTTTGKVTLTTVSNAEMDALIACAQSKGPTGAALVNGWTAIKTNVGESQRGLLKGAIEVQAKVIGCL